MADGKPVGRPTDYTAELATAICNRLATGESLREICLSEDMPDKSNVFRWLANNEEFRDQYNIARVVQADYYSEEIIEICDDGTNDWMARRSESEKGAGVNTGWVLNGEHVQRSRLRVDTRKWVAARLNPKKYGDRLTNEHSGPDGGPIETVTEIKRTIVDPRS